MKLSLDTVFFVYTVLFLALIFGSWFAWLLRRRRAELQARRLFICGFCSGDIPETGPVHRLRCTACGAVQERERLQEKER